MSHWTEQLFLEQGKLFLGIMKSRDEIATKEVEALRSIFSEVGVKPGDRVLDLCCGYGSHALRLAKRGFRITGVDFSPLMIKQAKKLVKSRKVQERVEFLVGDAREVSKLLESRQGNFNAIINMQTSIGYYDDETDEGILRQLNELASSNGVLVIDIANRDYLVKHFQPFAIHKIKYLPGYELHEHRKLNLERSRMENAWKFYRKEGEELKHIATIPLDNRLYSLHEIMSLLRKTGWRYVASYGNFELQPVTPDTHRIIIVGKNSGPKTF